jgi:hypothetical protein
MSPTTVPGIDDVAISNTYTVTITGTVDCQEIRNIFGASRGGGFLLSSSATLSADVLGGLTGSGAAALSATSSGTAYIYGNITAQETGNSTCVLHTGSGNLEVVGNVTALGWSGYGIDKTNSSGVTKVIGDVSAMGTAGNSDGRGIRFISGSGIIEVIGTVRGVDTGGGNNGINISSGVTGSVGVIGSVQSGITRNSGIVNSSTSASISVFGNVIGSVDPAISNTSTGSVTVVGNVIGDSRGGSGIASTNAAANVRISGNLIGAPNGIPAVYAASYTVNPVPYQTYIRYANNGTGVGSDAYLYHYTTDSLSAFSMPPVSAVRAGLQYANNTLTGTCQIPPVSSVIFGALVDKTTGTAILTSNNLWEIPISSLTATNSLGARLKNSATIESVGRILASFTF